MQSLAAMARAVSALLFLSGALAAPNCSMTGSWFYSLDPKTVITLGDLSPDGSSYNASCSPADGWDAAVVALDVARSWSTALLVTFYNKGSPTGVVTPGWLLGDCAAGNESLIYFGGTALYSAAWCKVGNSNCSVPLDPLWQQPDAAVHLIEVSHSDIGWLGTQDDLLIDSTNINAALSLMANDTSFVWQHECILFMRAYVEMFPEMEAEMVARIAEGRFDMGGTWTEPYEGSFVNELLARQMYVGRKWATTRYPGLDTAVVGFHQDGPLRALQTAQVYAKAGMRYMKPSRYSEEIVRWTGADGQSSLLAFPQIHYCTGAYQWGETAPDILYRMAMYAPFYKAHGMPPVLGVTWGCDYAPPTNASDLMAQWAAAGGSTGALPPLVFSNFKNFLDTLSFNGGAAGVPVIQGERPNIWLYEAVPTHHWMFSDFRNSGGRLLPAAEAFSTFAAVALAGSFAGYPADPLSWAWLNVTLDDHGISGEPVPKGQGLPAWLVNDNSPPQWDMLYAEKWAFAVSTGEALLEAATQAIASGIDYTAGAPANALGAVVVFNTLSWSRTDTAVGVPITWGAQQTPVAIVDASGAVIPSQPVVGDYDGSELLTGWQWNFTARPQQTAGAGDGAGVSANATQLVFQAPLVPSMGYATYFLVPAASVPAPAATAATAAAPADAAAAPAGAAGAAAARVTDTCTPGAVWQSTFSTPYFSITPGRGGLSSVVDLTANGGAGRELFDTSQYDAGEWMQLEYTGMGASETRAYPNPWVNPATFQRLGNVTGGVRWTAIECGPVRSVFATDPVPTANSTVQLIVAAYAGMPRLDYRVRLTNWTAAFGVVNRVVFPVLTDQQNVSFATAYGVSRVGIDEAEDGFNDVWLLDPGPTAPKFDRGYALRPREIGDWIRAEGPSASGGGVTLSSSVGCWDWVDPTGAYPATQPVLAPEMLVQTTGNRGPFLPEPGQHDVLISIVPSQGDWSGGWRRGVQPNHPLRTVIMELPATTAATGTARAAAGATAGTLPFSHSFLNVTTGPSGGSSEAAVWVTAVKKEDAGSGDGVIVRFFSVSAADVGNVTVNVGLGRPLTSAAVTDLIEEHPQPLPPAAVSADSATLTVGHYDIQTMRLGLLS